jgi:AraC-like DNA-binding protein
MAETDDSGIGNSPDDSGEQLRERKINFRYGASWRIFANIPDINEISRNLGVSPTYTHRKGDRRFRTAPESFEHDMWLYEVPLKDTEPLHVHIDALWDTFREHKAYLLRLKQNLKVDVFLSYTSDCDNAGIEVPHQSLEIFTELQVPFGLSIIVI